MKKLSKEQFFNEFIRLFTRREAYKRIKEMLKPKVDMRFVEKWGKKFRLANPKSWIDKTTGWDYCEADVEKYLKQMLKEAGIEVEK